MDKINSDAMQAYRLEVDANGYLNRYKVNALMNTLEASWQEVKELEAENDEQKNVIDAQYEANNTLRARVDAMEVEK